MTDPNELVQKAIEGGKISMEDVLELADAVERDGYGSEAHEAIDELLVHTYEERDIIVSE